MWAEPLFLSLFKGDTALIENKIHNITLEAGRYRHRHKADDFECVELIGRQKWALKSVEHQQG